VHFVFKVICNPDDVCAALSAYFSDITPTDRITNHRLDYDDLVTRTKVFRKAPSGGEGNIVI
jgi:hypothetical protein